MVVDLCPSVHCLDRVWGSAFRWQNPGIQTELSLCSTFLSSAAAVPSFLPLCHPLKAFPEFQDIGTEVAKDERRGERDLPFC